MEFRFVPLVLPLAPRPLPDEVLSGWLYRVADANQLTFGELLESVRNSRLPPVTTILDHQIPALWRRRFAEFCRVPDSWLRAIDLASQYPGRDLTWFTQTLVFPCRPGEPLWQLCRPFCVRCGEEQREQWKPAYVPAAWVLAFQTHCPRHESPLIDRCGSCGSLALPRWSGGCFRCRLCSASWQATHTLPDSPTLRSILSLQQSLASCLAGQAPESVWFGNRTAAQGLQITRDLTCLLLHPAAPGLVLADLLVPEQFPQRYNIGGRFWRPQMANLPWFARFLVLAALHQLTLAFSPWSSGRSGWRQEIQRTCFHFFYRRSAEERRLLAADIAQGPAALASLFEEATATLERPSRRSTRRPKVKYSEKLVERWSSTGIVHQIHRTDTKSTR